MTEFTFMPESQVKQVNVPFYEDATKDFAPYYTVLENAKSRGSDVVAQVLKGQQQISLELGKLGALVTGFIPGVYGTGDKKRYGYEVRFAYGTIPGIIKVAGLPMRKETPKKKDAVMVQALWNVRDWLKGAVTNRVFSPGSDVLIPYLLWDGKRTIAEILTTTGKLPELGAGSSNVIDGEFTIIAG